MLLKHIDPQISSYSVLQKKTLLKLIILLVLKYKIVLSAIYFVTFDRISFQFDLKIMFEMLFFERVHKMA